jgi:mono/diheme cytochrome c family protein
MAHSDPINRRRLLQTAALGFGGVKWLFASMLVLFSFVASAGELPNTASSLLRQACFGCHDKETSEGGLDLTALSFDLNNRAVRERWVRIHDRIEKGEMPPQADDLPQDSRTSLVKSLQGEIHNADLADIRGYGRGPMRRLNRDEFEQNLRDVLKLPQLDIRDMLPEDREGHRFNKTSETLDMSRVQLAAYLDAADAGLRQAMASGPKPTVTKFRAVATSLFPERSTFGEREAMFFAKDNKAVDGKQLDEFKDDPAVELALFRSAHWPYYGYPRGFVARLSGEYRVRFSARAVLQTNGYVLKPATQPVPMTFRARKPSGPDVSGDVRATGGILDIHTEVATYETAIRLRERETFEYSLLGLPVPLARNVKGGPPTYRYPPFPADGQPGVAFQWLEVEGPLSSADWPPESHRVLFDEQSGVGFQPADKARADREDPDTLEANRAHGSRLLRRFVNLAAREPVPNEAIQKYEKLVYSRLEAQEPFVEAVLAGYQAFLCSSHFLYLREPERSDDHYAIASRLSHFLINSRPDTELLELARTQQLSNAEVLRREADRLIASAGFERFIRNFTDYWLSLRHIRRDEPDIRLYPEYRFDDYLVESMERETRAFVTAMIRENLPSRVLVDADFAFVNDRLARHYGLPDATNITGSAIRKIALPPDSPFGGLLTQAAILKVTANGTSTSPVVRGAWIMERLIGEPPPPPPPSVPAVEPDIRGAKTIRDLLALHTKSESCAGCHARFDPVGLALENFDIFGGWRTRYRGVEQGERMTGIDRAGHDFVYTLAEPVDAAGQLRDGRRFQNIRELKAILAANPRQLARNLLHQFTLYATGTPVRFADRVEIEAILDGCAADGYRVRDLLHAFVQSRIFLGSEQPRD